MGLEQMAPIWQDWALLKRIAENTASNPDKRPKAMEGVTDISAILADRAAQRAEVEA